MVSSEVVLVVESEERERDRLAAWLEDDGFRVIRCPGPTSPDYTCVGSREGACPLVEGAAVVVLDLDLPGQDEMKGATAEELLSLYLEAGRPVVAMGPWHRRLDPFAGERVAWMPRHPERTALLDAVRVLLPRTETVSEERGEAL